MSRFKVTAVQTITLAIAIALVVAVIVVMRGPFFNPAVKKEAIKPPEFPACHFIPGAPRTCLSECNSEVPYGYPKYLPASIPVAGFEENTVYCCPVGTNFDPKDRKCKV